MEKNTLYKDKKTNIIYFILNTDCKHKQNGEWRDSVIYRDSSFNVYSSIMSEFVDECEPYSVLNDGNYRILDDDNKIAKMVIEYVTQQYSISVDEFMSSSKIRIIVDARRIFSMIMRRRNWELNRIGRYYVKELDHSTIINQIRTGKDLLQLDKKFALIYRSIEEKLNTLGISMREL